MTAKFQISPVIVYFSYLKNPQGKRKGLAKAERGRMERLRKSERKEALVGKSSYRD